MSVRIVITGAPASAKTSCLNRLQGEPEFNNFIFFEELARQLLKNNETYLTNPLAFHREIYRKHIEREDNNSGKSFISDRGTIDGFAFYPETKNEMGTSLEKEYCRYSAVIQLESSAALGPDYYANDHIRGESIDQALQIEKSLRSLWSGHPAYTFIPAQHGFELKYLELLAHLRNLIHETKEMRMAAISTIERQDNR